MRSALAISVLLHALVLLAPVPRDPPVSREPAVEVTPIVIAIEPLVMPSRSEHAEVPGREEEPPDALSTPVMPPEPSVSAPRVSATPDVRDEAPRGAQDPARELWPEPRPASALDAGSRTPETPPPGIADPGEATAPTALPPTRAPSASPSAASPAVPPLTGLSSGQPSARPVAGASAPAAASPSAPSPVPSPPVRLPETAQPVAPLPSSGLEAYRALLKRRIEAAKRYPFALRRQGIEGRVDVRFRVRVDGRAEAVSSANRSVTPILVAAALEAVRRAAPFPPPPDGSDHEFTVTLEFRLE